MKFSLSTQGKTLLLMIALDIPIVIPIAESAQRIPPIAGAFHKDFY
ncbi:MULTISPECIES: hypothetical protein [unclassified Chryseobacterium]|nr:MULTISPECIES: hypothetical protein [unclassified Chryseobacterium]PWW27201.1 hypothetical protein DEU40_107147 [Chryseobacterium sp. AG844]